MDICLIDTSIFDEILNIPGKSQCYSSTIDELDQKLRQKEHLFLPMATILECGNHIAQIGNGTRRRGAAERFIIEVCKALEGISPFIAMLFHQENQVQRWLDTFLEGATIGRGLGDISIIEDWNRICKRYELYRVYIWSKDKHLQGYDSIPHKSF